MDSHVCRRHRHWNPDADRTVVAAEPLRRL